MKEFFTRGAANTGIKVPLRSLDGKETEHWLHVLGADSDAFRHAEHVAQRRVVRALADMPNASDAQRADLAREARVEALASLITGWSFEQPCDTHHKMELLREAPQIADMVDRLAVDRSLFINGRPASPSVAPGAQPS